MNLEEFNTLVPRFADRADAARRIAETLSRYRLKPDTIVLGLPHGGIVVAKIVAGALGLPHDCIDVRTLDAPGHFDLAIGAIAPEGVRVINWDVVSSLRVTPDAIEEETRRQELEMDRLHHRAPLDVARKTVILVDDGVATGAAMEAAIAAVRHRNAARVVVAVPVAPVETCRRLRMEVDDLVCLETPEPFFGVRYWYRDFPKDEDIETSRLTPNITDAVPTIVGPRAR